MERHGIMFKSAFYIKLIHALLFLVIAVCTVYIFYSAVSDQITKFTCIAFGIAAGEMLVLLFNNWQCPLTDLAEEKGAEMGSVADLFLPEWFSDYLFIIFGIVFVVSCLLLAWQLIQEINLELHFWFI